MKTDLICITQSYAIDFCNKHCDFLMAKLNGVKIDSKEYIIKHKIHLDQDFEHFRASVIAARKDLIIQKCSLESQLEKNLICLNLFLNSSLNSCDNITGNHPYFVATLKEVDSL